jgi:hypothetical protein
MSARYQLFLSFFLSFFLTIFLSLSFLQYICLSPSYNISVSLLLYVCLSFSFFLSIFLSYYLYYPSVFLSLSISFFLSLSLSLSIYLSISNLLALLKVNVHRQPKISVVCFNRLKFISKDNRGAHLVQQSTTEPKIKGLNPVAAITGKNCKNVYFIE